MYVHRKDRSALIATLDLHVTDVEGVRYVNQSGAPYYVRAYLWETQEAMDRATGDETSPLGLFVCTGVVEEVATQRWMPRRPLMGELHFQRGRWTEEVVAHEVQHALSHRLRILPCGDGDPPDVPFGTGWQQVMGAVYEDNGLAVYRANGAEEEHCHQAGRWFAEVYRWLWANDAHGAHAKAA